jgi:DNA-directed RNA polymerase subunit omega
MDPHIVFDCAKVIPNTFELAMAAAARTRALARGAAPCVGKETSALQDLALREIAGGKFSRDELRLFALDGVAGAFARAGHGNLLEFRGGGEQTSAAATTLPRRVAH